MNYAEDKSQNIKRDFKLKDGVFVFSSFTLICVAIIFTLILSDILTIESFLSFHKPIESFIIAVIASVVLLLFGIILTLIQPSDHIDDSNKTYQENSLPAIFIFMFIAALFEEVLFRGIIQNLIFLFTNQQWSAILLTALLFIAVHVQYFKKPIMLLNICIPSVVFGWVYFITNNILVPVFVHFIMNFGMTILFKYKFISFKR